MRYVILSDFQMSFPQKVKSYPHYPHKISTSCEYLMWIMWITFLVFYFFKGSFDGKPAFLGYFPAVFLTFLIFTSDLPMSVPGNWNLSTPHPQAQIPVLLQLAQEVSLSAAHILLFWTH